MARIRLEAAADLVQQYVYEKDPVRAVTELIWNALDADAHNVAVTIERSPVDAPERISVVDDGHGMTPERVTEAFGRMGGSWKRATPFSEKERRPLHGRAGRGRLRVFALGDLVRWITVADAADGRRLRTVVTSTLSACTEFEISEPEVTDEPCGTQVEAWGKQSPYLPRLISESATGIIEAALAPSLLAYSDIRVLVDGRLLDPRSNIEYDQTYDLPFAFEGQQFAARLRVIEWKAGGDRKIHLCDAEHVPIDEVDSELRPPDFRFSAYTLWEQMADHRNEYLFDGLINSPAEALVKAAKAQLRKHFDDRRDDLSQRLIAQWKAERVYPYGGEPQSDAESVERALFNVVSTQIQRHLPQTRQGKQITLNLLKGSLQHQPEEITNILSSVLHLSRDDRSQLDRLLARTSLAGVIRTASSVANRLDFLAALEQMVFDPVTSGLIQERVHLHKMLERELWIFGEQFNMMVSDRSLTNVLRQHLRRLGRDPGSAMDPVRRLDGRSGRVDLALTTLDEAPIGDNQVAAADMDHDRNRHLVVELKAPGVDGGKGELDQIKDYAKAVAADARFAHTPTDWDFWLVVKDVDDYVDDERRSEAKPFGLAHDPQPKNGVKVRVWVKTWNEILEECRRRLKFYRERLEHDPSLDDALDYLRTRHGDLLPEQLRTPQQDPDPDPNTRSPETGHHCKPVTT